MMLARFDNLRMARAFSDYLRKQRLSHRLEAVGDGMELWVDEEAQLDDVRRELASFREDPGHSRYLAASWQAPPSADVVADLSRRYGRAGDLSPAVLLRSRGPVTLLLFFACLAVALYTGFGARPEAVAALLFPEAAGGLFADGQPWRVITPILLHFGGIHLIFNLLWWWTLAGIVEQYQSSFQLAMLTLGIGLVSNAAQFYAGGANFGGLSGVIYGLIGYLWLYGLTNPQAGYQLRPAIVNFMLIWLALGFTGWIGPVANTAHLSGLAAGAVIGLLFGWYRRRTAAYLE